VLGAVALLAVGLAAGAFDALHAVLEREVPWVADSSFGLLLVACGSGGAFVLVKGRRGRRDQHRLVETEAMYQAMVEQVPAVAYSWDPAYEPGSAPASYISPQIERLLGFGADRWLDEPGLWERQVHPDDIEDVLMAWSEAIDAGAAFTAEYRITTMDWFQTEG
jgi:PAS domain-containing protein